ncbi:MAG: carboxy terminal-processing peptidase, partial [Pseudomonadales bacterium]|nr:carboxy terminal-processing peptidase [Pseudomonadales bacterium]
ESLKKETVISLNEEKRKAEQEALDNKRLAIENTRRAAKGQELLKTWREAEDQNEEDQADELADPSKKEKPEDEAFVKEAAEILLDASLSANEVPVQSVAKRKAK